MAALVVIAADGRAVLAAQVPLQFVDRRRLRPADGIEGNCLMGIAAEAADLQVKVAGVDRVAESPGRAGPGPL